MIIYKTTNLINGKFYIGKDSKNNPKYFGSGILLKKAIKKYGKENFKKEIIEECDDLEELSTKEKYWIDNENAVNRSDSYNIALGGHGGDTLSKHPNKDNIIKKLGRKGRISNRKGIEMTDEQKEKISTSLKLTYENGDRIPTLHDDDTRTIISQKCKESYLNGRDIKGDKNPMWGKGKKILVDGIIYNNMRECSEKLDIHLNTVKYRLNSNNYKNYIRIDMLKTLK